jgi:transposase
MILKYSVGLDVSGADIKCCISTINQEQKVKVKSTLTINNTKIGFKHLKEWIEKFYLEKDLPLVICMEATGVYHENCAYYLFQHSYKVSIILPNKAKKYLQAIGLKSKNDKIDSKGLSQMGAEQSLNTWQPINEFFYKLRALTRQHQRLQQQRTSYNNQLHAEKRGMFVEKIVIQQLTKSITFIDKRLSEIEKAITKHISSNKEVNKKMENICLIKGLGILTVAVIITETNGFELFENYKQLVSYAGYDVIENQSGKHIGKTKISKKGNSRIRRALFMPALVTVRHNEPVFKNLYERTFVKHGVKLKSYVAVQKNYCYTFITPAALHLQCCAKHLAFIAFAMLSKYLPFFNTII